MDTKQASLVCAAYAFSPHDLATLTEVLAVAYLEAFTQAYRRAQVTAARLASPAQSVPGEHAHARQWAAGQAKGIAATYAELLRDQVATQHDDDLDNLAATLEVWLIALARWKSQQIARTTWSAARNAGTRQWIAATRAQAQADPATARAIQQMRVRVIPETSSNDVCAKYAGRDFALEAVEEELPLFPVHPGCVHSLETYLVTEGEEV